jgi:hypothetical protein
LAQPLASASILNTRISTGTLSMDEHHTTYEVNPLVVGAETLSGRSSPKILTSRK